MLALICITCKAELKFHLLLFLNLHFLQLLFPSWYSKLFYGTILRCAVYYWILLKKIKFRNSSIGIAEMLHTLIFPSWNANLVVESVTRGFAARNYLKICLRIHVLHFPFDVFQNEWSNSHKYISAYVYRSSWHMNITDEINHQCPQELTVGYEQCQP